jgi:hypothetical protein
MFNILQFKHNKILQNTYSTKKPINYELTYVTEYVIMNYVKNILIYL